jgi:hypothetical protein
MIELPKELWINLYAIIAIFYVYLALQLFEVPKDKAISINKRRILLSLILLLLIMALLNRWEVWLDPPYSYHYDRLTTFLFMKQSGRIVGKANLPQNAILISQAITVLLYTSIIVTSFGLLKGIKLKKANLKLK